MHIGASTFIWVSPFSDRTIDLIERVRSFGFDLIEICIEDPDTIDPPRIRERLKAAGLGVTVCGAYGPDRDISADDPAVRANGVAYAKRCVELAAGLGSRLVAGPMYAGVGATRMRDAASRRQQWDHAVENLRAIAAYAGEHGITLAAEPLNRFETDLVNTVEQGLRLCADVGSPHFGLLLDTFHMNVEEKSVPAAIRSARGYIAHFHACASDRGTPGEDHLPWPEIATALRETGYAGPAVIEAFNPKITAIAHAVSLWRPLAESEDALAKNGLAHLRQVFA